MNAKLVIYRPSESYGERGHRTRIAESELTIEERGGCVAVTLFRGAVHGEDLGGPLVEPEQVAATVLNRDEVRALAAFLSALPADE